MKTTTKKTKQETNTNTHTHTHTTWDSIQKKKGTTVTKTVKQVHNDKKKNSLMGAKQIQAVHEQKLLIMAYLFFVQSTAQSFGQCLMCKCRLFKTLAQ